MPEPTDSPEDRTPSAERQAPNGHPAITHRRRAAEHLRQAAHQLDLSVEAHAQRAHATAAERATDGTRHIDEARAHLREADRLHHEYEQSH